MPMDTRSRLLALLRQRAFKQGDFVLSSGEKSNYYIDGKMIEVCPEGATLIGQIIYERTKDLDVNSIGGPAVGSIPLVASAMVIFYQKGVDIEGFWVREQVKSHGTKKLIEGKLPPDARVAIVDDVVTSGDSVMKAIEAVEEAGGKVVKIISIVDRQGGAQKKFRESGYNYEPVFIKDELFAPHECAV